MNEPTDKPNVLRAFTVKRSEWGIGKLCAPESEAGNKRCCLGFAFRAAGLTDEDILYKGMPSSLPYKGIPPSLPKNKRIEDVCTRVVPWLFHAASGLGRSSQLACDAAAINDHNDLAAAEKEVRLIALFAAAGITITFED